MMHSADHRSGERRPSVLFVDDEPRVLSSMRALFRRDYNVHLANSGSEALALLEREEFDVIVSDQRMPGMTGVDVLSACKLRSPRAMRILLTGYADKDAIEASINESEVFRYLTKPCAREELRDTVAMAAKAAAATRTPSVADVFPDDPAPMTEIAAPVSMPEESAVPATVPGIGPAPPPAAPGPVKAAADPVVATAPPRPRNLARPIHTPPGSSVDVLVLSCDAEFTRALESALGRAYRVHTVTGVDHAMEVLDNQPIGVLITDIAIHADEVQALTHQLKHHVPELVTVVASDHSDAHRLIDLINGGQVFRFLLKPIKPTQTAIWVKSAVSKHLQLVSDPRLAARHAVPPPTSSLLQLGDRLIRQLAARIFRGRTPEAATATRGSGS